MNYQLPPNSQYQSISSWIPSDQSPVFNWTSQEAQEEEDLLREFFEESSEVFAGLKQKQQWVQDGPHENNVNNGLYQGNQEIQEIEYEDEFQQIQQDLLEERAEYIENPVPLTYSQLYPCRLPGPIRPYKRVERNPSPPYSVNRTGRPNAYNCYLNDQAEAPNWPMLDMQPMDGDELDTLLLNKWILHELQSKQISQTVFARRVLDRGQSTVSSMLNNPKHWKFLKEPVRDSYKKILKWLKMSEEDKMSVLDGRMSMEDPEKPQQVQKPRKPSTSRTIFTFPQVQRLEAVFAETEFLDQTHRELLAAELNVPSKAISGFFQNARRKKYKKEKMEMTMEIYQGNM